MSDEEIVVDEKTGEVIEESPKVKAKAKAIVPYEGKNAESMFMSTSGFELIQRWGKMLATSSMVPEHLSGQPADCALIVSQAMQWGLNPLVVAQSSYTARGKVGYEGKLIASLVNRELSGKLNYKFSGEGRGLKVVVSGRMKNEDEDRLVDGSWDDWSNDRNPAWKTMPKQMMVYRGAREWARRHNPGVITGIMSIDEVQDLEVREEVIDVSVGGNPDAVDEIDDLIGEVGVETPIDAEVIADANAARERQKAAAQREMEKVAPKKRGRPRGSKNKEKEEEPQPEQPQPESAPEKSKEVTEDDLFD